MKKETVKKIKKLTPIDTPKRILYIICVAVQSLLTVFFALSVKNLVNAVELGVNDALDPNSVSPISIAVIRLIVVVAELCAFGALCSFLGDNLTVNAEKDLRNRLFKNVFLSNYQTLNSYGQGDIISRFEGDVSVVSGVRVNLVPAIVSTCVRLVGTLVAMLYLDYKFTLIVVASAIVFVGASIFVRKIAAKLHKKERAKNSKNYNFIQESIALAPVIKAFGHENYLLERATSKFNEHKLAKLNKRYFTSFIGVVVNILFTGFYVAVAIYGVYGIKNGNTAMSFGLITAMLQLVLQIKAPVTGISRFFTSHAEMIASGERLLELSSDIENKELITDFNAIKLEGVSFAYGDNEVLKNINLTVNKGDKVLIKGASGAGKSTLIKVILNLYSNCDGKVKILTENGEFEGKTKGLFAFVPQDSKLFSTTVKENVILGEEYSEERFNYAIENSHFKEVIETLKDRKETVLGDGVALSEGQAQRLSVARALYSKAPVIVLDEPTSHLDGVSEEALFKNLSSLEGLTVIMVSHKKESENYATAVYALENGELC